MTIGSGFQGGLTDQSILKSADLSNFAERSKKLKEFRATTAKLNNETLYPGFDHLYKQGHHWGWVSTWMHAQVAGACQVACISENNVPIVGKKEVHRQHEMTWLRIDRYYYGDVESPNVFCSQWCASIVIMHHVKTFVRSMLPTTVLKVSTRWPITDVWVRVIVLTTVHSRLEGLIGQIIPSGFIWQEWIKCNAWWWVPVLWGQPYQNGLESGCDSAVKRCYEKMLSLCTEDSGRQVEG